ncbi:GNAT family N-acetyltransferase [Trichocoleus sp. FACHB-262]|uniref:GNAT family N-acetyltransferase n=1 Tax=Trichocoleus sp. FACHB-262 TaxID=2692869 RepID=UPI00168365E6|nr:GNAT family protein [Trichocoleus sp. FACHB-262]MBD2119947.1 GNAT family N-acetyltransferase [Trichocoleus sp. FACHB-262]
MLAKTSLSGSRVRLTSWMPQDLPALAHWYQQSDFLRLLDAQPAYPYSEAFLGQWLEERQKSNHAFIFAVRAVSSNEPAVTAPNDMLLGYVELDGILWNHQVSWISIAIGEEHWGHGYGFEAMQLALTFAFEELNLHRIQLTVFSYNDRAIALYEKLGFQREGIYREFVHRSGDRHDMYLYGLLRPEWKARFG